MNIIKLTTQLKQLNNTYSSLMSEFGNAVVNFVFEYKAKMGQVSAKVGLIREQLEELMQEEAKKNEEK